MTDGHLEPIRLFEIARNRGARLSEKEGKYLHDCQECQPLIEVFARPFNKPQKDEPENAA
jgi:hypothetical protein